MDVAVLKTHLKENLDTLQEQAGLTSGDLLVIGTSTSEVAGRHIGSAGSDEVAAALFEVFTTFSAQTGAALAFQGCEHINRALVLDKQTAVARGYEPVTVVPQGKAGGAMSTYAYKHMAAPVVVEHIQAEAGIDIGDTLIGMHIKPVAVPVRGPHTNIGDAHVTMARTRPKLIGGARAIYE
ncbi:uncharacterized protein (TIGR01440 family) [Salsuginibacillus halophilus]|uniref:UPF0340 protein B0H94_10644 n=1 Tax=Salsuginibacillus halophilus TaxID=517424 RepID=A0A2P8HHW3_9BACI|nr:TIGR01440 family protein [Salsuginibacillus halophilus]PSL45789.1 uncharacterized protein (TIGR01440 family) [Salsuginibacillus halophilus]